MLRRRHNLTRPVAYDVIPLPTLPQNDPRMLAPDTLRDQAQSALSRLGEADRKTWLRQLYTRLARVGVNIGAALFMLGIVANSFDELTPSDLGKLLRYLCINDPATIKALASPMAELLVTKPEPSLIVHGGREAA